MAINNSYNSPFRQHMGQTSFLDSMATGTLYGTNQQPQDQLRLHTLAENQLQNYQSGMGGGHPGYGGYGSKNTAGNLLNGGNSTLGQTTPWTWGGPGGKAATGIAGISALGSMYLGNEARKLGAADLDFRQQSYGDQYAAQRALQNDQMFDRQQFRMAESGMNPEQAKAAADRYVSERGVQQRKA
jgi:hypothetical protein